MRTDDAKTRVQIHLQLRVRALLFDKASVSLFLRSDKPPSSIHTASVIPKFNPNYLQLHGDDVYFTLDNCSQDGAQQREGVSGTSTVLSKVQSKSSFGVGSRYSESESNTMSQRLKLDDLPETCEATPQAELGYLNIGGRPTRRKSSGGIGQLVQFHGYLHGQDKYIERKGRDDTCLWRLLKKLMYES